MAAEDDEHRPYEDQPRPRFALWLEAQLDRFPADSRFFLFLLELPGLAISLLGLALFLFGKLPLGMVAIAAGLACIAGLLRYLRHRRVRQRLIWQIAGRCIDCGYDLRASPVRCPECGLDHRRVDRTNKRYSA